MLELLAYLRANGFKTFIVSGGGVEFMRPWAEKVYGIPPEQVVGSQRQVRASSRDGEPVLVTRAEDRFIDDGDGKPVGIHRTSAAGRSRPSATPTATCRCCSGPRPAKGARLALLVHHTDAAREYAYDRKSRIGKLDKALDEAKAKGWTVVSMKTDWKRIFRLVIERTGQ